MPAGFCTSRRQDATPWETWGCLGMLSRFGRERPRVSRSGQPTAVADRCVGELSAAEVYSALHMKLQWADFFQYLFRTNVRLSW